MALRRAPGPYGPLWEGPWEGPGACRGNGVGAARVVGALVMAPRRKGASGGALDVVALAGQFQVAQGSAGVALESCKHGARHQPWHMEVPWSQCPELRPMMT